MTPSTAAALLAASAGAGVMNSMAGGGTILTFPALLLLGEPAVKANATSTVALLPGAAASLFAYRREVEAHRAWLTSLLVPSLVGGAIGSLLLLATPDRSFARLAPWLVLFATVLFMLQAVVARKAGAVSVSTEVATSPQRMVALFLQFFVAIYGGYFGAGIGILMLAILGFMGLHDIHAMNGLKNFFGICINGVAAALFIAKGAVDWPAALVMLVGAAAGGYAGARFARRIGKEKARTAVVVIGLFVTVVLLLEGRG
ncbi:MAG TPA: sulfite exporter TauE/SafE family protein [Thermoanaerobaculia bacterium]|nr:sulfite exporter TauE/SafE family protein [Thermoanaerobaculia bacterium]